MENENKKSKLKVIIPIVIVVILLLILSVVSINAIVRNDSAIKKAQETKTASENADELDEMQGDDSTQTGTPIEDVIEADKLKVGDYVDYTPDTTGNSSTAERTNFQLQTLSDKKYTALAEKTGYETDQTIEQENLNWRIFSIDKETGQVLLISETPTHRALALHGSVGWLNAEDELNNACKTLYSNSKLGEARHITIDDINKAVGKTPTLTEESTTKEIYYPDKGGTQTLTSNNDDDYELKNLTKGIYTGPAELTPYVDYLEDASKTIVNQMITGGPDIGDWYYETSDGQTENTSRYTHWVASRDVYMGSYYAYLYVRFLHADTEGGRVCSSNDYLFHGNDSNAGSHCVFGSLRPIVTLKSNLRIDTDDGQETHDTQQTAWHIQ